VGSSSARAIPLGTFTAWAPSGVTDTVQLLQGVIDALTAAPDQVATVVVGVDDAHLLDDLSAFVVHQIVQRGAAKVILTVRSGEPLPAAIQEIWKVGQFDRLDVDQLSLAETTTLLAATLAGPVDPDAAQRLWKLTRGNALYLRNIVEQEVADGRIVHDDGHWRWIGDPIMPPGLGELIESRIGAMPTPVSDVIDVLAVGERSNSPHSRGSPMEPQLKRPRSVASSRSSAPAAASRCDWRIRSTHRYAAAAQHTAGCGGCADWWCPNSRRQATTMTSELSCAARR
jgi:hypothetical protein